MSLLEFGSWGIPHNRLQNECAMGWIMNHSVLHHLRDVTAVLNMSSHLFGHSHIILLLVCPNILTRVSTLSVSITDVIISIHKTENIRPHLSSYSPTLLLSYLPRNAQSSPSITPFRMFAQLSAYSFGALLIVTGLNAFRAPSQFSKA